MEPLRWAQKQGPCAIGATSVVRTTNVACGHCFLQTWLKYWLVLSVMAFVGLILDVSPLYHRLPLYLWIKIAVVAYLVHPQTLGYKIVYEKVLEPHLSAQAHNIDQTADTIQRELANQANTLGPRVNQFVNQGRDMLQRRLSTMQGKPPGRPKTT